MDSESDSDDEIYLNPAKHFGWHCFICKTYGKDGLSLEMQFLSCDTVTAVDKDNRRWVRCDNCGLCCHVQCLNKGTVFVKVNWEVIEQNGRFTCC